jgi:hypothetical protein
MRRGKVAAQTVLLIAITVGTVCCGRKYIYFEDAVSHSVKVKEGFFGKERMVYAAPSFQSASASWTKGVTLAAKTPVSDGDSFLVKIGDELFAVEVVEQKSSPEKVTYRWRARERQDVRESEGRTIIVSGVEIYWSYISMRTGRIYCAPFFLSTKPAYEIGTPYFKKAVVDITNADFQKVRFSPFPWEL